MVLSAKISELDLTSDVVSCGVSTPISEVREILQQSEFGSIAVVEDNKVVGIFTERDYLKKIAGNESATSSQPVSEFMTKNPKSVSQRNHITDVISLMDEGRFRHVLVISTAGELQSIISMRDIINYMKTSIDHLETNLQDLSASLS